MHKHVKKITITMDFFAAPDEVSIESLRLAIRQRAGEIKAEWLKSGGTITSDIATVKVVDAI